MESLVDEFLKPQEIQNINKATTPPISETQTSPKKISVMPIQTIPQKKATTGSKARPEVTTIKITKTVEKERASKRRRQTRRSGNKSKSNCYQQNGIRRDPIELEPDGTAG